MYIIGHIYINKLNAIMWEKIPFQDGGKMTNLTVHNAVIRKEFCAFLGC